MRRFLCEQCQANISFADARCSNCAAEVGYEPVTRQIRALRPEGGAAFLLAGGHDRYWRCLNAAWGCNWLVPTQGGDTWCRSCRLTRGRPDTADPAAVATWMTAESAKRRVVAQLDQLGLPIRDRGDDPARGLAFDLVHVPGAPRVTGHYEGVITLDLTEADDVHRAAQQSALGEPYRTVIGHLRHELGHYYLDDLVAGPADWEQFHQIFGDEKVDYAAALKRHYESPNPNWRAEGFISAYASAHPLEDWAELFAHYLAIRDAVETMSEFGLVVEGAPARAGELADSWATCASRWPLAARALNAVAEGLGQPALYPIDLSPPVLDKLAHVDRLVQRLRATTEATRKARVSPVTSG